MMAKLHTIKTIKLFEASLVFQKDVLTDKIYKAYKCNLPKQVATEKITANEVIDSVLNGLWTICKNAGLEKEYTEILHIYADKAAEKTKG